MGQVVNNGVNVDALLAAREALKNTPGIQGIWSFSATNHDSSMRDGIALQHYVKGQWVPAQ